MAGNDNAARRRDSQIRLVKFFGHDGERQLSLGK
jgi:hypothetical protein